MHSNELIENEINEKIPPGSLIKGIVTIHAPFGIFLDIGMENANAVVDIIAFVDEGGMDYRNYPPLGTQIEAVVFGVHAREYSWGHQFKLGLRPSLLKEAYEKLEQGLIKRIDLGSNRGRLIKKFPIGTLLTGTVDWIHFSHVRIRFHYDYESIYGQINFNEFLDEGEMDYSFYPLPLTEIETVVIGYTDFDQLELSAKPSLVKKAREAKISSSL